MIAGKPSNDFLLQTALDYADYGYPVFPCVPNGKRPITNNGFKDASTDPAIIENWWNEHPTANIGMPTEGMIVIDDDKPDSDWPTDEDKKTSMMSAAIQSTPSGGRHFVFRQPADKAWRNTTKVLGPNIDTRGNGGYILLPPSAIDGNFYRWLPTYELSGNLVEPPPWLIELLDAQKNGKQKTVRPESTAENLLFEGRRNSTLTSLAGTMRRVGMNEAEILAALKQVNSDRCSPPLELDEVMRIARSVSRYEPEESDSLPVPKPYIPFPVSLLPESLARFVEETSAALGCDPAYVALPALSSCASAIGMTRAIQLKPSWCEPSIIWACIIARSGTLKSPASEKSQQPLIEAQTECVLGHKALIAEHEAAIARWEIDRAKWKKSGGPGEMPLEPIVPIMRRFIVGDTTIEALAPILQANPRGVLLARDELAAWIRGFNQYKNGKGGDAQSWLELWRAGVLIVDRKSGDSPIIIRRTGVSVYGTIQPGVFAVSMRGEGFESGLAARLLAASPPEQRKRWSNSAPSGKALADYADLIRSLLTLESLETEHGPEPFLMPLTAAALDIWVCWYNRHAERQHEALNDYLAAAMAKIEAYAARFSLIFGLTANSQIRAIDADAVQRGTALADWFSGEAERIYAGFSETVQERDRRGLVEWITRRGGSVTVRDLCRGLWRFRGNSTTVRKALAELVAVGIGFWDRSQAGPGRPSVRFILYRHIDIDETRSHEIKNKGSVNVDAVDESSEAEAESTITGEC